MFDVSQSFYYWTNGGQYFNFTNAQCAGGPSGRASCMNWQQIMSSTTTSFGCGSAVCDFGTQAVWLVCNYKKFGQYSGTIPYTISGSVRPTTAPTPQPSTPAPSSPTSKPATQSPATAKPSTQAPTTKPATQKPATPKPTTQKPATAAPSATLPPTQPPTQSPTQPPTTPCNGAYCTIDYRNTYLVQSVKDQKQCGSCWAFGATAVAESAVAMKLGRVIAPLAEQSVLDCSSSGSCKGGWPLNALGEMISRGGVDTMSSYPYTATKSTCKSTSANYGGVITKKFSVKGSKDAFYQALKTYGPIGIAVDANSTYWSRYRSGVISYDSTAINHAVTVVGYDAPLNAWIVRNSWGSSWGQSGHIYIDAEHPAGAYGSGAWYASA